MLKNTGERIGTCGFHCHNRETSEIEMGYDLYPTYWRQGFKNTDETYYEDFHGSQYLHAVYSLEL